MRDVTPRIMIAGTGSGSGKTTVSCAILGALSNMGLKPMAYKCGPDYIDPMFHEKVTGIGSGNLDIFLMGESETKRRLLIIKEFGIQVIEGVMGLYDGIDEKGKGSANEVSILTETPVILVVNVNGKGLSVCAEIKGFLNFLENRISGVILNSCSTGMFGYYKDLISKTVGIPVLGHMPNLPEAHISSRNLGLITADEIDDIKVKLDLLSKTARETIDMGAIVNIAETTTSLCDCMNLIHDKDIIDKVEEISSDKNKPVIYTSDDEAFCFYYKDNIKALEDNGAEIRYFSPLRDKEVPIDADGILLWGGYPEHHAKELSENKSMRESIKRASKSGMPIYGECGGFMYLHDELKTLSGESYQMCGVFNGTTEMTDKLQDFGYATLLTSKDNVLSKAGESIRIHNYHQSLSTVESDIFIGIKEGSGTKYLAGSSVYSTLGMYPHIHFAAYPSIPKRFVEACKEFKTNR